MIGALVALMAIFAIWSSTVLAAQLDQSEASSQAAGTALAAERGAAAAAEPTSGGFPVSGLDLALALGGGVFVLGLGALVVLVLPRISAFQRSRASRSVRPRVEREPVEAGVRH